MRRALPLLLLVAACRTAPPPAPVSKPDLPQEPVSQPSATLASADYLEIERMEDARTTGGGKLQGLTRDPNPAVRRRALIALARLQSGEDAGIVAAALEDPEPSVRETAAFALGQLGMAWLPVTEEKRALAEDRLLERLQAETDRKVRDRLVEALGKLASQKGMEALVDLLAFPAEIERAALALGILAKSSNGKLVTPRAVSLLVTPLKDGKPEVRYAAAYALMRMKDPSTRGMLLACLADREVHVRALCVKGMADIAIDEDVPEIRKLLGDTDDRVAAEAARSLARLAVKCPEKGACPAIAALEASRPVWNWPLAAAVAFEPITRPDAAPMLRKKMDALSTSEDPLVKSTLARTECQLALAHDRAAAKLDRLLSCGRGQVSDPVRMVLAARALSSARGNEAGREEDLLKLSTYPDPRVRAAAVEGLASLSSALTAKAIVTRLGDADGLVVAAAAESAEKRKLAEAAPALEAALGRLDRTKDVEALQAVFSAAGVLGLKALEPKLRPFAEDPNAGVRDAAHKALVTMGFQISSAPKPPEPGPYASEMVPDRPVVKLTTSRGVIRIRLLREDAPMATRNFVSLVRKKYFDGLSWHRVVPNFVSQGGDPRGDGSGGPGYTIRCEPNPVRYSEGTVGMALSGKDTGGSQFFITHSPQPHLDGRYTVFGEVVEGLAESRSLVEGDVIERAELE